MELVGRAAELAVMDGAIAAAAAGEGTVVTVAGEPGIGKSALLAAARTRAEAAGLQAVLVRAAEHEQDVPFGLASELFAAIGAGLHPRRREELSTRLEAALPATPEAEELRPAERFRLHRELRELLEQLAGYGPLGLLIDDVQWIDPGSLELLLHLLARPVPGPLLVVLAMRPGNTCDRILDAAQGTARHAHLVLRALDTDAALAMIAAEVGDEPERRRLVAEAGGHPLYLRELARAAARGEARLPATVAAAVAVERGRLDEQECLLADGAAVAGDPFDAELAAVAAGLEPPVDAILDRLVASDLVRPAGEGALFAFRHPLVHRAVYDAAPPAWRIAAHARVAERLAQRRADPIARAFHVEQSAQPSDEEAIALLREAADRSAGRAPQVAVHWRRAALRLLPGDDLARKAQLLAELAADQSNAGHLPECRAALLEALALAPDDLALTAALASVEQFLGASAQARRRLGAVVAHASPQQRPLVELELAAAAYFAYDAEALRVHARAAAVLPGAPGVAAGALGAIAALWHGDRAATDAKLDEAAAQLAALDDGALGDYPQAAIYLGVAQCLAERLREGTATLSRGVEVVRATGRGGLLAPLLYVRGMMRMNLLEIEASVSDLEAAEESARLLGLVSVEQWTLAALAGAQLERGDAAETARAVAAFERIDTEAEETYASVTARCNVAATRLLADPARCLEEMLAAGGPSLERVDPTWSSWQLRVLVRAAVALGRLDDAARWAELAAERARSRELPVGAARAAGARAEVLLARGETDAALATAREARTLADRTESGYEQLDSELLLARALVAAGAIPDATEVLQALADRAATVSALRFRDAAVKELRALGVRVAGSGRRGAGTSTALSPREQEIAELVARGRSNREVAATLFLSEKTVEYHLSNVYAKLGVRSRVELAGVFAA